MAFRFDSFIPDANYTRQNQSTSNTTNEVRKRVTKIGEF